MSREQGRGDAAQSRQRGGLGGAPGAEGDAVRVLLAEHHPIYRVGIRRALGAVAAFSVVAETSNGIDAIALAASLQPDVAVVAVDLPDAGGVALVRAIRLAPSQPGVVLLSERDGDDDLFEAVRLGAAALLSRQVAAEALVETVRQVSRGEAPIDGRVLRQPAVVARLLRTFGELQLSPDRSGSGVPLSPRELEVLSCLARGKSNKEVGRILSISDQTVKNHISSILRKLAVGDRTQAVVLAVRRGWIDLSEENRPLARGSEVGRGGRKRGRVAA